MFNKYGSDKGDLHGPAHCYGECYEKFFHKKREDVKLVLEIGIEQGSSINVWCDYFPNSKIIGLDIDDKTFLDNDRISTFKLDQSSNEQLKEIVHYFTEKKYEFDIIIDDGSHHMLDQQLTFGFLFPFIKRGGFYVIEDLHTSLADSGVYLYGRPLNIKGNKTNTTLHYLSKTMDSDYLSEEQNSYIKNNIKEINIHTHFNKKKELHYKNRSITSVIKKN